MSAIRVGVVAMLVMVHLLLSFVGLWLTERVDVWLGVAGFAWCLGQVSLVALVVTCGSAPIIVRWPLGLLLATALWFLLSLGIPVPQGRSGSPWMDDYPMLVAIFLGTALVVSSMPFWLLRAIGGWRLTLGGSPRGKTARNTQFRLSELLAASLMLAASGGLVAAILRADREGAHLVDWVVSPLQVAILTVISYAVVLPSIYWAYGPLPGVLKWLPLRLACLFLIASAPFVVMLLVDSAEIDIFFLLLSLYSFALCLCVAGTLAILRSVGIRLERGPVSPLDERLDADVGPEG